MSSVNIAHLSLIWCKISLQFLHLCSNTLIFYKHKMYSCIKYKGNFGGVVIRSVSSNHNLLAVQDIVVSASL